MRSTHSKLTQNIMGNNPQFVKHGFVNKFYFLLKKIEELIQKQTWKIQTRVLANKTIFNLLIIHTELFKKSSARK